MRQPLPLNHCGSLLSPCLFTHLPYFSTQCLLGSLRLHLPLPPLASLPPLCPHWCFFPPLVQGEQTELPIISVWQRLFCALIKGAACGLCVSGVCRRRRWANANITCLIIYVWEMGTKAWGGWGVEVGGVWVFIGGTDALRHSSLPDSVPRA